MTATSQEQSQRLIDAGIKQNTADMQYNAVPTKDGPVVELFNGEVTPNGLPAWSLSALWDAARTLGIPFVFSDEDTGEDAIRSLVSLIEYKLRHEN
ncbi:MAG: hypothetical protein IK114_14175 [Fibrobacter sp.]|nr:hypothetical protein [Fibrobacter sp.]